MNKIFRVLTLCEFSGQVPWAVHVHLHVHVGVHVHTCALHICTCTMFGKARLQDAWGDMTGVYWRQFLLTVHVKRVVDSR